MLAASGCAHHATHMPEVAPAPQLGLNEFFKLPVGPKGLEPTDRLLAMNGKRVTVQGYMVKEEEPLPGLFMLTPVPTALAELADGPADYLPPATLFVHLPEESAAGIAAYRPGTWNVTGRLELGSRQEVNGRVSYVRLIPDRLEEVVAPQDKAVELQDHSAQPHHHH
ncbi:uncharacterized protein sS8_3232 [Methylocaldum marinum]|uniref:Uncharacterized protein n=1 Tax=Methylocaldum marinum TaxID=1432792 RepID=A0A250KU48_9GAMM|nr:hypothetical protein [Methylocaldum marinum]BBA35175.1 uncharacterized protein sS8_3232 [Methylocaldum marinum]